MNIQVFLLALIFCLGLFTDGSAQDLATQAKTAQDEVNKAQAAFQDAKKPGKSVDELNAATINLAEKKARLDKINELLRAQYEESLKALPSKADTQSLKERCLMERPAFGDFAGWLGLSNWSVGTAVSTKLVSYNFSTKRASSLEGLGGGPAFRYYGYSPIGDEATAKKEGYTDSDLQQMKTQDETYDKDKQRYQLPVYKIKPDCRASSLDVGKERREKLAASVFSITPTFYISKLEDSNDLSVQPALLLGLFDDIISVGYGFNLTGPHQGRTFLVFGLGLGFKF